jgi:hypothetical protein
MISIAPTTRKDEDSGTIGTWPLDPTSTSTKDVLLLSFGQGSGAAVGILACVDFEGCVDDKPGSRKGKHANCQWNAIDKSPTMSCGQVDNHPLARGVYQSGTYSSWRLSV